MKKQKRDTKIQAITVTFGYIAFAIMLLSVIVSTVIPLGTLILDPLVRQTHTLVIAVSLTASALLPPLLAYIIGDRATHGKAKLTHHFNGVLFGVAAYWLAMVCSLFTAELLIHIPKVAEEPFTTFFPAWPIVITTIIMAVVAAIYAHQKRGTVLENRLFQVVFFSSILGLCGFNIYSLMIASTSSSLLEGTAYTLVPIFVAGAAYWLLGQCKLSEMHRIIYALTGTTFGLIVFSFFSTFLPYNVAVISLAALLGLGITGAYTVLLRRNC